MKIDTLKDIIHWTRGYHARLSEHMNQSAAESGNERTQMLLGYLSGHEKLLAEKLSIFERSGDLAALNTWCYEFIDQNPILKHHEDEPSLADMGSDEIVQRLMEQHQEILRLYRHLLSRAETDSTKECLTQLLSVEEHEVMTMMQGTNRFSDM